VAHATGFSENQVSLKNIFQQVFKASQSQGVTSSIFHLLNRWRFSAKTSWLRSHP
jgi:hypothetical protein